ncbi:MAG: ABC transporter permease [Acidimicrobiales bacterium]|nr:ABC transporter permease [Acidimicrobiales bacterium]
MNENDQRVATLRALRLISRREVTSRITSKAFIGGILTTVFLIFAVFGLGALLGGDDPVRIGVSGPQPTGVLEVLERTAQLNGTQLELTEYVDRDVAAAALEADEVDGVVVDGEQLLMTTTQSDVVALVTPAWQQAALIDGLSEAGLDEQAVAATLQGAAPIEVVELDPDPGSDGREGLAFVTVIMLFISIQVAGAYILMGVFEEKSTKVVELVLSSVRARHLLLGKIIGVGVLGLVQVVALAGSALVAAALFSSADLPALSLGLVLSGLAWFVLGYLLYGSVFAAGASLAPRQEDAQSTLAPVSVLLMLSYFGALFSASDPTSVLARVVSWVPVTAPFAMPGRIASGDAVWWEVAGAMLLTAVAAGLVLMLAERIYVRSIIHTDRKLGWREAWSLQG